MKILVCAKQCFDPESKIVVADGKIVETGLKRDLNPYDVVAITVASKLKKAGQCDEVVVVSVGETSIEPSLRTALAIGADRAILAAVDDELDESGVVNVLAEVCREENPDLILMGHISSDLSTAQVPSRLAQELNIPAITMADTLNLEEGAVVCTHEQDDGTATSKAQLPALVSVQVYITQPNYVAMRGLIAAKKKELLVKEFSAQPRMLQMLDYEKPPRRQAGRMLDCAADESTQLLLEWMDTTVGIGSVLENG